MQDKTFPLGGRWIAAGETDEGLPHRFALQINKLEVHTAPSSAPSGHLPPRGKVFQNGEILMMKQTLSAGLPLLGLDLSEETKDTLCAFGRAMVKQNEVMNLTGITDDKGVANLHLLDSLTVMACADLNGKTIIDVGCGAGFPGVPLAIASGAKVTLLDSLGKRMKWLEEVLPTLGISAECVTARAEEANSTCRESYDFATSRAVARLNILLELTAPYVKVGGKVLAMTGAAAKEELAECGNAIKKLGLKLEEVKEFPMDGTTHAVIVLRKVSATPPQFPRRFAKIKQSPL